MLGVGAAGLSRAALLAVALAFAQSLPAWAQLGPVPALPLGSLNRPNGPAALGPDGTLTSQTVRPPLATASATLGQAAWDHPSIRLFGAACDGVSDDSKALATATRILAGTDADIFVPGDCRLNIGPAARLAGSPIVFDGVNLRGPGGRDSGLPYGTRGGTILLTDAGGPAFVVKRNWRFEGLVFFWPGQIEGPNAPVAMPPLLTGAAGAGMASSEVSSGRFVDNDVVNAWHLADFTADPAGGLQVRGNRAFCLDACLLLSSMPLESFISDNQFTPNAYFNAPGVGVGPTFNLRNYAGQHGAMIQATGNGTATTLSTNHVDGLTLENNVVFGMGYGLRVTGGWLNLLALGNNTFDGTGNVISVETGGVITSGRVIGGTWTSYAYGTPGFDDYAVKGTADSAPGTSLRLSDITVSSTTAGLVDWRGASADVAIDGVHATGLNNSGIAGATTSGIRFDSAGGRLKVVDATLAMQGTVPGVCIDVINGLQSFQAIGNTFITCSAPISLAGTAPSVAAVAVGNTSVGTTGAAVVVGSMGPYLVDQANQWDKPGPNWSQRFRPSDGALVFSNQGHDQVSILPGGFGLRSAGPVTPNTTP